MKAEELINRVSKRYDCPLLALHKPEIVTKKNAQYAVEIARQEEREKAIDAFKQLQCYGGKDMDCYYCSCRCNLSKFRKIINQ